MPIPQEKLKALDRMNLEPGSHPANDGKCAMEAVAWLAGEPHSDSPACTSPVFAALVRGLNDNLADTQRQKLKPLLPRLIGTRGDTAREIRRAYMCANWAVRVIAPLALDDAGERDWAQVLRDLPDIVDEDTARWAEAWAFAADAASWAAAAASRAAAAASRAADAEVGSLRFLERLIEAP